MNKRELACIFKSLYRKMKNQRKRSKYNYSSGIFKIGEEKLGDKKKKRGERESE